MIVGANLRDMDISTYVANLQTAIDTQVDVPARLLWNSAARSKIQQRAMRHLMIICAAIAVHHFGIDVYDVRRNALCFPHFPQFAVCALRRDFPAVGARILSIGFCSIGFVALFGVAVLNGIVLVSHLNEMRRQGKMCTIRSSKAQPIVSVRADDDRAGRQLGFILMAFNVGPGSEVQRPLATVVIGGLITATFLTLFVLPTIYNWLEKTTAIPRMPTEETFEEEGELVNGAM